MMSANKLSISFHDFDAQGDCCADITLPVSGTVISGYGDHMALPGGDRMGRGEKTDHRSIPKGKF